MDNPYKVLGIREGASQEEIKAAYKILAKKYHPDKYVDNPLQDLADNKMRQINAAYDQLTKRSSAGSRATNTQRSGGYAYSYSGGNPFGGGGNTTYSNPFNSKKKWPFYYYIVVGLIIVMVFFASYFYNTFLNSPTYNDSYATENPRGQTEEEYGGQGSGDVDEYSNDPYINYVMSGSLANYPDVTISDAVSSYLTDVEWKRGQNSNGKTVVEAAGYTDSSQSEVLALHFTYNDDGIITLSWAGNDYEESISSSELQSLEQEIFGSPSSNNAGNGSGSQSPSPGSHDYT